MSELAMPCGTCGKDVRTPGQWLACREHFVADIKHLIRHNARFRDRASLWKRLASRLYERASAMRDNWAFAHSMNQQWLDAFNGCREQVRALRFSLANAEEAQVRLRGRGNAWKDAAEDNALALRKARERLATFSEILETVTPDIDSIAAGASESLEDARKLERNHLCVNPYHAPECPGDLRTCPRSDDS